MKPLEGLRVLTLEQFGAGPTARMFLADLGAEVIKIENRATGGDPAGTSARICWATGDSQYFQTWNIEQAERRARPQVADADQRGVAAARERPRMRSMNNLRGDQPAKLGLDYAGLRTINPSIVCLHISAYGRDNDRTAWPGYDYLMQAEAGLMSLTGEPDGPPTRVRRLHDRFHDGTDGDGRPARLPAARASADGPGLRRRTSRCSTSRCISSATPASGI